APTQAMIVPIAQHKEGVLDAAADIRNKLADVIRVDMDDSDKMPGWKFNECEMKGYPVRIETGPKDIEKNQAVLVRRDTNEKDFVALDEIEQRLETLLEEIQQNLFDQAYEHRENKTTVVKSMEEMEKALKDNPGFMKAMW